MQSDIPMIRTGRRRNGAHSPRLRLPGAGSLARYAPQMAKAARVLGLLMVGAAAIAGFFVHPAVGIGLTVLAALRLGILWREEKGQAAETSATVPEDVTKKRPVSARRSRRKGGRHG